MNVQNMKDFVSVAKDNGVTHILLEFITLGDGGDWSSGLKLVDTVSNWVNDFTNSDRSSILKDLSSANIKLGISMGGANCFNGNLSYTWTNSQSPYYIDGSKITSIEQSASKLGKDLATIAKNCGLSYIDLDIENIPTVSTYTTNYDDISNYLGNMSKSIKENLTNGLVSHSPQTPYLYPYSNGNWKTLYYTIEQNFGDYIDWYNIQYYNQGTYSEESQVFTNDVAFNASVKQLQNGVAGLTPIPAKKIVVGGGTDSGSGLCKNSSNTTGPTWTTLSKWVKNQENNENSEWYNNGGVMSWVYGINSDMGYNSDLKTYWNNLKSSSALGSYPPFANPVPNNTPKKVYKEHQVITSYNETKTGLFCHTEDPKILFISINMSPVNKKIGLINVIGNVKFNNLNFPLNQLVTLTSGLPVNPFDLIKNILGGTVKTLTGIPSIVSGKSLNIEPELVNTSIKAFTSSDGTETVATYGSNIYTECCCTNGTKTSVYLIQNISCSTVCEQNSSSEITCPN